MNIKNKYNIKSGVLMMLLVICIAHSALAQSFAELTERARAAGIEQAQIAALENRAEQRGISSEELTGILTQAVTMAEQNLPHEMIFQKAFEGIAKGISAARMKPVLESITTNTGRAAEFVDAWVAKPAVSEMVERGGNMSRETFRNEMIKVSSNALGQNFDGNQLNQILNSVSDDDAINRTRASSMLTAVNILADLPAEADSRNGSADVVIRALRAGFSSSDLQKLPEAIHTAQNRSQLPAAAVVDGVAQQLKSGVPATEILQNLFNGNVAGGPPGMTPPGLDGNRPGRNSGNE